MTQLPQTEAARGQHPGSSTDRRLARGRWLGVPMVFDRLLVIGVLLSAVNLTLPDVAKAVTLMSSPHRAQPARTLPSRPSSQPSSLPKLPSALHTTCPTDLEPLTQKLLQDLPGYANRYIIRQTRRADFATMSQVVVASAPDFTPLPLSTSGASTTPPDPTLKQVFFTTLERQTTGQQLVELQQHHWLFLTPTPHYGWRLAMLYTRLGSYPAGRVMTPPRESSEGPIGQAIALWLRDCQAGAILPTTRSGPPLAK
jgi:hypothetical protein